MIVTLLLACAAQDADPSRPYTPPVIVDVDEVPVHASCVPAAADPLDLPVDWCLRVSPEPGDVWPDEASGGVGHEPGEDDDEAIDLARCGVFNVLGVFGTGGPIDAPSTFYCDSEGGLRLASVDGPRDRVSYQHLQDTCVAVPDGGALVQDGDVWRGWWLGRDAESAVVVHQATMDGAESSSDMRIDAPGIVRVAPVDSTRVLAFDGSGVAALLTADGVFSDPLPVRDHVAAVPAGDALLLGACDEARHLAVVLHGDVDDVLVEQEGCWPWAPPRVAWGAGGWAAAWQDDTGSVVVVNDAWLTVPEGGAVGLVADGETFVATVGGSVLRLDASGTVLATRRHPVLAGAGNDVESVDLTVVDGRVRYQVVHLSTLGVGDHLFAYNRLELSVTPAP